MPGNDLTTIYSEGDRITIAAKLMLRLSVIPAVNEEFPAYDHWLQNDFNRVHRKQNEYIFSKKLAINRIMQLDNATAKRLGIQKLNIFERIVICVDHQVKPLALQHRRYIEDQLVYKPFT